MKLEETISTLESLDRIVASAGYCAKQDNPYCTALNEAINYLNIFADMFEGAKMTNHKENDNECTAI